MLVHPQFDPVAISIGPVSIHWYGLTYLVAFGLFLWLASLRVARPQYASLGWQRRDVEDMLFYGVHGHHRRGQRRHDLLHAPVWREGRHQLRHRRG